jgi:pSer/pThr/pTyr-binding forkhead associated (FHA) protein
MSALRLTVYILDRENETQVSGVFVRSPVLVGRAPSNDIRLSGSAISRRHGQFLFGPGSLQYFDLGSRNGTKIDGHLVEADIPIDILARSIIEIGRFRLTLDLHRVAPE